MPYCPRCGVELDEQIKKCPLCKTKIILDETELNNDYYPNDILEQQTTRMSFKTRRKVARDILAIITAIIIATVIYVNFKISGNISWGWYPILSTIMALGAVLLPLYLFKHPIFLVFSYFAISSIFLLLIDFIVDFKFDWFIVLGVPIIILLTLLTSTVVFASVKSKKKGANLFAFILIGISLFCIGVEITVLTFLNKSASSIIWSPIVVLVLLPGWTISLYVHYKLKRPINFKKFFSLR